MRIVITGGHFSPAYSVLTNIIKDNDVLVIGRKNAFEGETSQTFEYKICKEQNIPFEELVTGRLQRNFSLKSLISISRFPSGIYSSLKMLKKFSPDVVVTFGGYIGLPVAIASRILGIPVILHEQTQRAGLSSRLIAKFASIILISFESSREYFKNKEVILTGNPLRQEFFENEGNEFDVNGPLIYITGGSTGSHFINVTIEKILPQLLPHFQIFHQAGNSSEFNDYGRLRKINHKNYNVKDFFTPSQVFELLRKADLVISRSGINTVNEIIASGAVSLLIPLPIGQLNEQLDNAKLVKKLGIGEYVVQKQTSPKDLLFMINDMIKEKEKYKKNIAVAQKSIIFDGTHKIIEQIYHYGQGRERKELHPNK